MSVERLFGVQFINVSFIGLDLCMREKKEQESGKKSKFEIFMFNYLTFKRINGTLGVGFTLE